MKQIIIILLFFFSTDFAYAQNDIGIEGKWKPIAAFDGDIYINSKTDSFSISEQFKKLFGDSLFIAKKVFQMNYLENRFEFNHSGIYYIYPVDYPKITGTYLIKNTDSTILLNRTDVTNTNEFEAKFFLGEAKKFKYFFEKSELHLYLEFEERHVEFILQKEAN